MVTTLYPFAVYSDLETGLNALNMSRCPNQMPSLLLFLGKGEYAFTACIVYSHAPSTFFHSCGLSYTFVFKPHEAFLFLVQEISPNYQQT